MNKLANIETAINDIRDGKMIILVDDESRENEGDLVMAAEKVTPEAINFMCRYGRGLVCLPMMSDDFERLNIPMMAKHNRSPYHTAFGVSFEAAEGVTTGISAHDRAKTILTAVDDNSAPQDIIMPGHVFPLKARQGGVLKRGGHTEGSVDIARLAGLKPAGVLCEIMSDDGSMARLPELLKFGEQYQLTVVSIQDLITYRINNEVLMEEVSASNLPLQDYGEFTIKTFKDYIDGGEQIALISNRAAEDATKPPLVRIHSECLTGDVFGSARCDCGRQLELSLSEISKQGGVLLYLRQEGRGIGLSNKIKAYALQDSGLDTVEANHRLGFSADIRDYAMAAQLLHLLKMDTIRLLTNNPHKINSLEKYQIEVSERIPLETIPTRDNIHYLRTKRKKMGHLLDLTIEKDDE